VLKFRFSRASLVQASALAVFLFPAAAAANTITVNSSSDTISDDSTCTLREAILSANTNTPSGEMPGECAAGFPGHDTILFDIPGAGVHTIQPTSAFPVITEPLTIDGYSQPGTSRNTSPIGNIAILLIEINGSLARGLLGGLLEIEAGSSTVSGLVINFAWGPALRLVTNGGNTVAGNIIGLDATGQHRKANECYGVAIDSSSGNTIGGLTPGDRNTISGSLCAGLAINASSGNQVINNYIGTSMYAWSIEEDTASKVGVLISSVAGGGGSTANVIGGTNPAARNVISGNWRSGTGIAIVLTGPGTSGNIVQGNSIGLNAWNEGPYPNGAGIQIDSSAHDNLIGGTIGGAGNWIAFNGGIGVSLERLPSPAGSGNAILGNLIHDNSENIHDNNKNLGIDLNADGVTANDSCDADAGPNDLQNFPLITLVTAGPGSTRIQGTLDAAAGTTYRLEFFASNHSSGIFGQNFLGSAMATTDPACHASFDVTLPVPVAPVAQVTATATDDHNNTSEFSPMAGVQTQFFTVTPCRVADTRDPPGPSGGPALVPIEERIFPVAGICGIPPTARAVAIIAVSFEPAANGDLLLYPASDHYPPNASSLNFRTGVTRANFGIIPLSLEGEITAHCDFEHSTGTTNFFFDVYGYYQ
jgi:CSLREA domain-containing protein